MANKENGFTVIELAVIIVLFFAAGIFFFIQKNNINIIAENNTKKTAINAMYYSLEEVFYPVNGYYPQKISTDNLKSVDPALFTDTTGYLIGESNSSYSYTPLNCTENKCKSYELKATLQNEADYIKKSKRN